MQSASVFPETAGIQLAVYVSDNAVGITNGIAHGVCLHFYSGLLSREGCNKSVIKAKDQHMTILRNK